MASIKNRSWYYSGCMAAYIYAIPNSMNVINLAIGGIGAGKYFLEEVIVHTNEGSSFGF